MTPYYDDGSAVIYHGDCLEVLPALAGYDLVFTSPPYNLGVSTGGGLRGAFGGVSRWSTSALAHGYDAHDDAMPPAEYEEWQRAALLAMWAGLSELGAIFYNHKPRVQAGQLWLPLCLAPDLPVRQIITWARKGGINFTTTHYMPTYEWIVVFARPGFRLRSQAASGVGDLWRVQQEENTEHPAPFPLGLPARAIETTAPSCVLDPFMGSGTTLRAAKNAGVRSIGIDTSERYCEMAARRLAQEALDFGART